MELETCLGILISWPFFAIPAVLLERLCSCYFPFLLSSKFYLTIHLPNLQNILISPQLTRPAASQTSPEDRNKLPLWGCVYCAVALPWLLSELIITITFLFLNLIGSNIIFSPLMAGLKSICFFLFTNRYFWIFLVAMPVFYRIDYSLGLRRWQKRQMR